MIKCILPPRQPDKWGQGHYGAPRGNRLHNGIDMNCPPEAQIFPSVAGTVTKHGWVSSNPKKQHLRYIEITDDNDQRHRYMYVEPIAKVGEYVSPENVIGKAQNLESAYPGITNHIHYEIKLPDDSYIDPTPFAIGGYHV